MRLMLAVLAGLCLCISNTVWATVYEWVDSQGVVNMTDDPDKVPDRYRKVMKVMEIDTAGENRQSGQPAVDQTPAPVDDAGSPLLPGNDGHDRNWWQTTFGEARERLKNLNAGIEENRKNLEELHRKRVLYQKPSDRVAYYALLDQITKDEAQAKILQQNLADLESKADAAGVPQDWR